MENKFVLEKIVLQNVIYYIDKEDRLWNSAAKLVGYMIDRNEKQYILI